MIGELNSHFEENCQVFYYFSDDDYDYSVSIGDRCTLTIDDTNWLSGVVVDIKSDFFVLKTNDGSNIIIHYKDVYDIHCEDEIGTINKNFRRNGNV